MSGYKPVKEKKARKGSPRTMAANALAATEMLQNVVPPGFDENDPIMRTLFGLPQHSISPERLAAALDALRKRGTWGAAQQASGLSSLTLIDLMNRDENFAAAVEQAKHDFATMIVDGLIEQGVKGIEKPLLGGQFRDEVVAYERVHNPKALDLLAKVNVEGYKPETAGTTVNIPGVLVIGSRPETREEFEKLHGTSDREAIEGEFRREHGIQ